MFPWYKRGIKQEPKQKNQNKRNVVPASTKLSFSPEIHNRCIPTITLMSYIYSDEKEIESQPEKKYNERKQQCLDKGQRQR